MKYFLTTIIFATLIFASCSATNRAAPREEDFLGARASQFFANGDIPRAIEVYKDAFAAARRSDNVRLAAQTLSNIGRAYFELNQLDSAIIYFANAHEHFTMIGNRANAARSSAWMALAYAANGDAQNASRRYNAAVEMVNINKPQKNRHFYALMKSLIDFHTSPASVDESAVIAAQRFYRKQKDHDAVATTYILMANLEMQKGNCAAATSHLENALASMDASRSRTRRSAALLNLAKINFCTGNESVGRHFYTRARDTAPRGIEIAELEEVMTCNDFRCR